MNREELRARTEGKKMPEVLIEIGKIVIEMEAEGLEATDGEEECQVLVGIYAILSQVVSSYRPVAHGAVMALLTRGVAPDLIATSAVGVALATAADRINAEGGTT
jgi:hypothetical protein